MRQNKFRPGLALKLYFIILLSSLICVLVVGIFTYRRDKYAIEQGLGLGLERIAATAALGIDGDEHASIESTEDRPYLEIKGYLEKVAKANSLVSPIYTLKAGQKNAFFVVTTERGGVIGGVAPLNEYMKKAVSEGHAEYSGIYTDKNGTWISAYAPIKDKSGKITGLLNLDYQIDDYIDQLRRSLLMILLACAAGFIVAVILAVPLYTPIIASIDDLDKAAKKLEEKDYDYPVRARSDDELGHLAQTFDGMRKSIKTYIERLNESWIKEKKAHLESIKALTKAISIREPYTKGHIERVSLYSEMIARELGLSEDEIERIRYGCALHDVGKIGIDIEIINKSAKLTKEEYEKVKQHPEMGLAIIKDIEFLSKTRDVVLYHQERYDGKGYPSGLAAEDIPLAARIVALADAYDAMNSDRPYRKRLEKDEIFEKVKEEKGRQFDPKIVEAFLKIKNKILDA